MIPPIGRHGKPLGMVAHVAHSPERGWILRAVSEYFHRAKEEGLFVAIVLVPFRSSHEPNYSHEDPDQATGSGSRHAVAGWQDRAGQARSKKITPSGSKYDVPAALISNWAAIPNVAPH